MAGTRVELPHNVRPGRWRCIQIPAFPELFDTPDTPWDSSQPFGPLFSLDGIHPSAEAHRLVTNAIVDEIADTYDVQLSPVLTQ